VRELAITAATIAIGLPLGWYVTVAFCNLPGLKFSSLCGHNAYIPLFVFLPTMMYLLWFALTRLWPSKRE
jgi:hypothetical protein